MAPGKSRSGPIRQAIGPRKAHLNTLIRTGRDIKQNILNLVTEDADANKALTIELEELIARLESSVSGLQENEAKWQELIEHLDPEEVADEDAVYQQFVAAPDNHLVALDEGRESVSILQLSLKRLQANSRSTVTKSTSNGSSVETTRKGGASKLPKLILPEFHGDVLLWSQFWAIFEANIHNTDLRGVEKLTYLQGQLKGSALTTIEGLEITDDSYQIAVDLLKKRYKRTPEKVINYLYSQLKRLPVSSSKVEDMQRTFDVCERLFRQLKTEGEHVDGNRSLVMDVMSKYPAEVLTELSRRHPTQTLSTVEKVQTALREYIDEVRTLQGMIQDLEPFGSTSKMKPKSGNFSNYSNTNNRGASNESSASESNISSALAANNQSANSEKGVSVSQPCYFCNDLHYNSQCPVYVDVEERENRLDQVKRCRRCLSNTHTLPDCRTRPQRIRCYFCDKTGLHVSPLCPKKFPKGSNKGTGSNTNPPAPTTAATLCAEEQSVLSTAVALVVDPITGSKTRIRIIMDSGSHRSYVTESVARDMNLFSEAAESLNVAVFGSKRSLSVPTKRLQVLLELRDGSTKLITAHTTPIITNFSLAPGPLPEATRQLISSLKDSMADDFDLKPGPPDLLIGSDYFWEFITGARLRTDDGIYLIPSKFGLILGGRYTDEKLDSTREIPSLLCLTERQPSHAAMSELSLSLTSMTGQVEPDVDEFWSMERIGIADNAIDKDDDIAQRYFDSTVTFKNGRYSVRWPWKAHKAELPTNYPLALGRFRSLARRLAQSDNNIGKEYSKVIGDQLNRGVIEEVPAADRWDSNNMIHYLPHHPVIRANSETTKVRVVYDASARIQADQPCLNECMYRGPVVLPDLCSILIRFRLHKVALMGDIEKAYLQLGLHEDDRDVTRFLWFQTPDDPDIHRVTMYRFTRVPFGVISSQFLLGATLHHHLTNYDTPVAKMIDENSYVDNVFAGAETVDTAKALYWEAKEIFNAAGMNLREWTTNSSELTEAIPVEDRAGKVVVKILGLSWDSVNDNLALQANWEKYKRCLTKREVLQAVASFYDPLGLFQPCLLAAKCFLRDLWKAKLQWDEQLSESTQHTWKSIHEDIGGAFKIRIPRHVNTSATITIVAFADASADAYATTVYLRSQIAGTESDDATFLKWQSTLVLSKSRLAPRKVMAADVSLPRLELLGVVIAVRAANFVRRSIDSSEATRIFILTDSSCVMGWIRSEKSLPVFVANRIKEIRRSVNTEYHHVKTTDNPADLATRGMTGLEIQDSRFWWDGPTWLQNNSASTWPTNGVVDPILAKELNEIQIRSGQETFTLLTGPEGADQEQWRPFGINPSSYSSFIKLSRVTIICLKFLSRKLWANLDTTGDRRAALAKIFNQVSADNTITSDEIRLVQKLWIKSSQWAKYREVIESIRQQKKHTLVKQLNLFIDSEGLLRCAGRMMYAELPDDAIQPLLLPKCDEITILVIREMHAKLLHCGISHTLSQIRRMFWIPQGRNAVRKVLNRCTICRKFKGPPYALPNMPPWPKQRVSRSAPFQFIGIDYMGPVTVVVNDETHKMWIALFTCLTVRAVHLEPVFDCTAQSFIECLSRFISRRGCPEEVISDNAPQFRIAKNLLDRAWHRVLIDPKLLSYLSKQGVRWKFTTELAPWQGGVYERLVGVVKGVLRVGIGRQRLQWTQFVTMLSEVEAIVNSRPITYVHCDRESGIPLRPVDFLTERPTGIPEIDPNEKATGGDAGKNVIRLWKLKQRRLKQLWQQWHDDYLLSLRERGQICHKSGRRDVHSKPAVNEVVLVRDPDAPRGLWKLGIILKLLPLGNEKSASSAELRMPNGQIIRRPLNHLYQLELPSVAPVGNTNNIEENESFDGFEEAEVLEAEERTRQLRQRPQNNGTYRQSIPVTTLLAAVSNLQAGLQEVEATVTFGGSL